MVLRYRASLVGTLLLAACQDYSIYGIDSSKYPYGYVDTGRPPSVGSADTPCSGGIALPSTSAIDESCSSAPTTGTLYATVEWASTAFIDSPEYQEVLMTPVVGELTDDDGDGLITQADVPDVVIVTDDHGEDSDNHHGVLRILAGDSGTEEFAQPGQIFGDLQVYPYRYSNVALGDVDSDGSPDILVMAEVVGGDPGDPGGGEDTAPPDSGGGGGGGTDTGVIIRPPPPATSSSSSTVCTLVALERDGTVKWVNADTSFECAAHAPAIADLEGDGAVEVILGASVFDGLTGATLWSGDTGEGRYADYAQVGDQSFAIDLDGDGIQEVLAGSTVYDATGVARCSIDAAYADGFPAAADLNGDGDGEFVLVGNGTAHVHDGDCTMLAAWTLVGTGNGGPPTIADFDADGQPEIGIAEAETYTVYEVDGTVRWSMPVEDASSHATGSAVFDFDGDGRAEVVYADETSLWIFDGTSGLVRLHDTTHTSRTLHEYPVIVDVDGDGMTEIVIPQGGGHHGLAQTGVYVLGSADASWMGNREVWNQHAYSITNINDDLSVPAPARSNWPEFNTFRSGDLQPLSGGALADAIPYARTCEEPCEGGEVVIYVKVGNGGLGQMRGGVPVSLYAEDGGELRHLETVFTAEPLDSGLNSEVLEFRIPDRFFPEGVAYVVVDDDSGVGQVAECHEDNNQARLEGLYCGDESDSAEP